MTFSNVPVHRLKVLKARESAVEFPCHSRISMHRYGTFGPVVQNLHCQNGGCWWPSLVCPLCICRALPPGNFYLLYFLGTSGCFSDCFGLLFWLSLCSLLKFWCFFCLFLSRFCSLGFLLCFLTCSPLWSTSTGSISTLRHTYPGP